MGGGVLGHVEVSSAPPAVGEDDEDAKDAEAAAPGRQQGRGVVRPPARGPRESLARGPQPADEAPPGDHREEHLDLEPRQQRGPPVAGEDRHDGPVDGQSPGPPEPHGAERGIVEPDGEAPEVVIALADGALVVGEAPAPRGRPCRSPASIASAASMPACIASRTPVEKMGSRNAPASPTTTQRSPASGSPDRSSRRRSGPGRRGAPLEQRGRGGGAREVVLQALLGGGLRLALVHRPWGSPPPR